jgi:diguanylate cyclase (GGDEF)-like protein
MVQSDYKSRIAKMRYDKVQALMQSLPVMPTAIHVPARIMQLYRSPNSPPLEKFAEVLVADAALSVKVLELANSAWFCPTRTVTKVSDALRMIGLSNVLPLLFGLSLAGLFNKADLPPEERRALWQTSLLKGILSRQWARWRKLAFQEEAFLCGVLQDIALPAMFAGDRSAAPELLGILDLPHPQRAEREAGLYSVDHAQIGATLVQRLGLPQLYVHAVATHHAPDGPDLPVEYAGLVGGVQLAAAVPHGMTRLDEQAARRIAESFQKVAPGTTAKDFVEFIRGATESAKGLMEMLAASAEPRSAMKIFLQDVSDQIARTMFAAIGTSNHTIGQLQQSQQQLEDKVRTLCDQVARVDYDPLTGVLTREAFLKRADSMFSLAQSFEMGCAVGVIELDDFRQINQQHGHEVADAALGRVAAALAGMMHSRGIVGRGGGDEFIFIIVAPLDYGIDGAWREVNQALGALRLTQGNAQPLELKSSAGLHWTGVPDQKITIHAVIREAAQHMRPLRPIGHLDGTHLRPAAA